MPHGSLKAAGIGPGRYYQWRQRYGKVNEHNAKVPRDHWLESWERDAIVSWFEQHPLNGYRRLTYMMIDADVVCASASSVYRVLEGSAHDGLAQIDDQEYEVQTRKLSL